MAIPKARKLSKKQREQVESAKAAWDRLARKPVARRSEWQLVNEEDRPAYIDRKHPKCGGTRAGKIRGVWRCRRCGGILATIRGQYE